MFKQEQGFEDAARVVAKGMESLDEDVQYRASNLWQDLLLALTEQVKRGRNLEEATKAAVLGFASTDMFVRGNALNLFKALFKQEQGFEDAARVVAKGMESLDEDVQYRASNLWQDLLLALTEQVKRGRNLEEATKAAVLGFASTDMFVRGNALDLFKALFEKTKEMGNTTKKVFLEEATNVAAKGFVSTDGGVQDNALDLFKALFKQEQGFPEAMQAAAKGMDRPEENLRDGASNLWQSLLLSLTEQVKRGINFEEAKQAAAKGMESKGYGVRSDAVDLFEALFEQGNGFEGAEKIKNSQLQKLLNKYKPQVKQDK